MSTIDTSTWNPDADLNVEIDGIPLNSDAGIAQTWQVIRILMAAFKGDTSAIQALMVPFSGATASADGASGLVPKPLAGEQDNVLKGDGTWGTLGASDVPNLDASKITSGTIDIARLPAGALERLVTVVDQTARYALTTADVQLGDTVKEADTGLLYFVVDTANLGNADGYEVYAAGAASAVPWSGVTGKPPELGYLSGVTSAIQTQLDAKAPAAATELADSVDVNTVTTPGCYTVRGYTAQHGADTNGASLIVWASRNSRINQLWLSTATGAPVFRRFFNGSSWSAWRRLVEADAPPSASPASYVLCGDGEWRKPSDIS